MDSKIEAVRDAHAGDPPAIAAPKKIVADAEPQAARQSNPVAPERFAVLQALLADLLETCGREQQGSIPAAVLIDRYQNEVTPLKALSQRPLAAPDTKGKRLARPAGQDDFAGPAQTFADGASRRLERGAGGSPGPVRARRIGPDRKPVAQGIESLGQKRSGGGVIEIDPIGRGRQFGQTHSCKNIAFGKPISI